MPLTQACDCLKRRPDIDKNPNDLWARLSVGIALFTLQRLAEAKPHIEFAARELPNDARVQYRYAVVQEETVRWIHGRRLCGQPHAFACSLCSHEADADDCCSG